MKKYLFLIHLTTVVLFFLNIHQLITIFSIFILTASSLFCIISLFMKKTKIIDSILMFLIIVFGFLVVLNYFFIPFEGKKWISEGEVGNYVISKNNTIHQTIDFSIKSFENQNYFYVNDNGLVLKKEFNQILDIKSYSFELLKVEKYLTGQYLINIKNNKTKEENIFLLYNNGSINLNDIEIKMSDKSDNYLNTYGKAVQVEVNDKNKQYLFLNHQDFNEDLTKNDDLTLKYIGDEEKSKYLLNIKFIPPFRSLVIFITVFILLLIYFLSWKYENKIC